MPNLKINNLKLETFLESRKRSLASFVLKGGKYSRKNILLLLQNRMLSLSQGKKFLTL